MSAASHIAHNYDCTFETSIETSDHEDHTFNGIFFRITANNGNNKDAIGNNNNDDDDDDDKSGEDGNNNCLPVSFVRIDSLSVRGALGPMTVWVTDLGTNNNNNNSTRVRPSTARYRLSLRTDDELATKLTAPEEWRNVYRGTVPSSHRQFVPLAFTKPIILQPGQSLGLYVHSARRDDRGIVYDEHRSSALRGAGGGGRGRRNRSGNNNNKYYTFRDSVITIHTGYAHLSSVPFGSFAPWGGMAFRNFRAFVGEIKYGARVKLWTPDVHTQFPRTFRQSSSELFKVHSTSWDGLPSEVVLYILNFCPADWFDAASALSSEYVHRGTSSSVLPRFLFSKISRGANPGGAASGRNETVGSVTTTSSEQQSGVMVNGDEGTARVNGAPIPTVTSTTDTENNHGVANSGISSNASNSCTESAPSPHPPHPQEHDERNNGAVLAVRRSRRRSSNECGCVVS